MKGLSRQDLWQRLQDGGLVAGDLPPEERGDSPWYVRVMLGVAGWIGSLFLLGFVGAGFAFVMKQAIAALLVGALVSGGAYALFRTRSESDFFTQFGLAVGLAGQMMVIYGLFKLSGRNESLVYTLIFITEGVLTLLMPNFIYRVLSSLAAALALTFALHSAGVYGLASGMLAGGFALVWLQDLRRVRFSDICRPAGYGLALALLYSKAGIFWGQWMWWPRSAGANWLSRNAPWLGKALILLAFLAVVLFLFKRLQIVAASRSGLAALAVTGIAVYSGIAAPGLGQALLIIIVGFAVCNRVLTGIGLLASGAFLTNYYYLMQSTLLEKSLLLMGIGAVLLIGRLLASRWLPLPGGGSTHA